MATGTNTAILFMQRRENDEYARIASLIEKFCDQWQDMTVAGQENAFALYARSVWDVDLAAFSALLRGNDTAPVHALLSSYRQVFDELSEIRALREKNRQFKALAAEAQAAQLETRFRVWLREREREKMLVFFLANGQSVVLTRAPSDKNAEKAFLGYEFSNRKGAEGLKILSGTGQIETALYSETNDADPNKINTLIRQNFLGETPVVPKALAEYVDVVPLLDLIGFDQVRFDKAIGTNAKKKAHSGRWATLRLADVADISSGGTPSTKNAAYWDGKIHWATIEDVKQKYLHGTRRKITAAGIDYAGPVLPINTVLFSSRATIGEVSIAKVETTTNQGFKNFNCHADKLNHEYLYYVLRREAPFMAASCNGMTYPEISAGRISDWLIPVPPLPEQHRIARHLVRYDSAEIGRSRCVHQAATPLFSKLSAISTRRPLKDFCTLASERVDPGDAPEADFNYVGLEHIAEGTGESTWSGPCKGATIKSTKNVFRKGDVLYGKLRPYLNKVWIAEFDGVCTTEMLVLKPRIPATLLKYILLHPAFVEQAKAKMSGISLPRIKPAEAMAISVPDVDPQADKLAQMASDIEAEKLRQKGKLDRLRAAKSAYLDKWLG